MTDKLNHVEGNYLVNLARKTILTYFKSEVVPGGEVVESPVFQEKRATFVTLKKAGKLRGCIGSLVATEPLIKNVEHNAIHASLNDRRFPKVTVDEMDDIHIELSILSVPKPLEYTTPENLVSLLKPGVDGVILRHNGKSATFLPQVWEQLSSPEVFLSHLCRKAGLQESCWKTEFVSIEVYQVQSFEEDQP